MACSIELSDLAADLPRRSGDAPSLRIEGALGFGAAALHVVLGGVGSGKSLLLDVLAGTVRPRRGRVRFDGRDVTRRGFRRRGVAWVDTDPCVYPHLSVRQNLAVPLRRRDAAGGIVDDVAELFELTPLLARPARSLSLPWRQRVALARTWVRATASVVLLDEPFAWLSSSYRSDLRRCLVEAQRTAPRTVVLTSQDAADALTLADRVVVLDRGRVVQDTAEPADLERRPASVAVARAVGEPPMNVLPCRLRGRWAVVEGFRLPLAPTRPEVGEHVALVEVGLRPTDLQPVDSPQDALPLDVVATEPLGDRLFVHGIVGQLEVRAILPCDPRVAAGVRCFVAVPPDRVVVFADGVRVDG